MIRLLLAAGTLIWISGTPAPAAPTNLPTPTRIAVYATTTGALASPTNFFSANSNLVRAAVGSLGTDAGLSNHVGAVAAAGSNYTVQVVGLATQRLIRADGTVPMAANLNLGSNILQGVTLARYQAGWEHDYLTGTMWGMWTIASGVGAGFDGGLFQNGSFAGNGHGLTNLNVSESDPLFIGERAQIVTGHVYRAGAAFGFGVTNRVAYLTVPTNSATTSASSLTVGTLGAARLPAGVPTGHVIRTGTALGYGLTNQVLYVTVPTNAESGVAPTNVSLLRYGGTNLVGTVVVDTSDFGWNGTTLTARATGGGLDAAGTNYFRDFAHQTNVHVGASMIQAGAISNAALGAAVAAGVTRGSAAVTNGQPDSVTAGMLASSGVAAGTYQGITLDEDGRATAAVNVFGSQYIQVYLGGAKQLTASTAVTVPFSNTVAGAAGGLGLESAAGAGLITGLVQGVYAYTFGIETIGCDTISKSTVSRIISSCGSIAVPLGRDSYARPAASQYGVVDSVSGFLAVTNATESVKLQVTVSHTVPGYIQGYGVPCRTFLSLFRVR